MKFKILTYLTLIAASIFCIWIIGVVIFAGAYFIEGVRDGDLEPVKETLKSFFSLLFLILFVVSTIIAWFKKIPGSILMTLFSTLSIIITYEPEIAWIQISILFTGPILFLFTLENKKLSKIKETNSL